MLIQDVGTMYIYDHLWLCEQYTWYTSVGETGRAVQQIDENPVWQITNTFSRYMPQSAKSPIAGDLNAVFPKMRKALWGS